MRRLPLYASTLCLCGLLCADDKPAEKPLIIPENNDQQEPATMPQPTLPGYQAYNGIQYRMDVVELPQTLKFAGVKNSDFPNFANIGKYHDNFKAQMKERNTPYIEIGVCGNMLNKGDYIFGCVVDSLDNLPDGLVGFDTGLTKFAVITFRSPNAGELVGAADGPGNGMRDASEYIKTVWMPENKDSTIGYQPGDLMTFDIEANGKTYRLFGMIEIYKNEIAKIPEMCFYIPLKTM